MKLPGGQIDQLDSLQHLSMTGRVQGGPLDAAGAAFSFDADAVHFNRERSEFALPSFRAGFDGSTLEGALDGGLGEQGSPSLHATSDLKLAIPSLRSQLTRLGMEMPPMRDPTTLGALTVSAQVVYDEAAVGGTAVSIQNLAMQLDDTQLRGSASLPSLSPLAVRFTLKADRTDLDRYLEPPEFKGDPLTLPVANSSSMRKAFCRSPTARCRRRRTGVEIKSVA